MTNWHVVDKAVTINCVLYDKRQVPVELIGSDRDTDLALLKLPAPPEGQALPVRPVSPTRPGVQEGDFVMALGSPFGFQRSISLGIISNAQRYIGFDTEYKYNTWIQTDAAINPGNSGGPLIDTSGAIVGINTLGVDGSGIGFSIPASTVQDTVERLKRDGRVIRAYTGLRLQALKDFQSNTFVEGEHGVLIAGVEENSPAAQAGMRAGDILLSIDGKPVEGTYAEMLPEIWRRLADLEIDKRRRRWNCSAAARRSQVEVTPEQKGASEGEDFDCRRWNMTVKEINKYRTPQLYYLREQGVYIQGTRYPGNAATSGLGRPGHHPDHRQRARRDRSRTSSGCTSGSSRTRNARRRWSSRSCAADCASGSCWTIAGTMKRNRAEWSPHSGGKTIDPRDANSRHACKQESKDAKQNWRVDRGGGCAVMGWRLCGQVVRAADAGQTVTVAEDLRADRPQLRRRQLPSEEERPALPERRRHRSTGSGSVLQTDPQQERDWTSSA